MVRSDDREGDGSEDTIGTLKMLSCSAGVNVHKDSSDAESSK